MSAYDEKKIQHLLRQALPPVEAEPEAEQDLWPSVLRKLNERPAVAERSRWIWLDGALAAGLAVVAVSFPASIPLVLYYL